MMRQWTFGALAGLISLATAPAFGAVTINVVGGEPSGGKVTVNVTLSSGGGSVGGMQNDILFDSSVVNLASATACKINATIGTGEAGCEEDPVVGPCKTLSRNLVNCGTTPSAPGCEGQSASTSRFRGIVAATAVPNTNAIPDGTVLYSCEFSVVSAAGLPATLTNTNVVASDPTGGRLDATGTNGTIGGTTETPSPTPTTPPVETCDSAICINVGKVTTASAGKITVDVVATGSNLGGAQNDILFDSTKVSLASATACKINAAIGTGDAGCEEDPVVGPCKTLSRNLVNCGTTPSAPGCEGQSANISRFRGIIAATAVPNNNVIPSGTVLYSCEFDATATADLNNTNIVASDPFGARLDAGGDNGQICVGSCGPTNTPTPTPEVTPPTNTPTTAPTNTPTPAVTPATNTPTAKPTTAVPVATATATKTKSVPATGGDDDDGCNISTSHTNSNAILLLIPAIGLLALRRKRS